MRTEKAVKPPVTEDGRNLVFIFGLPRSGTTLLSLILGNHTDVLSPPEPWFLLRLNLLRDEGDPKNSFDDHQLTIGTREFLPEDIFLHATRAFAATAYNCHLEAMNKSIFVDKTPRYYHILGFIDKLFPQAKKIWLKRNPLDVAKSYRDTWDVKIENLINRKNSPLAQDILDGPKKLFAYFDVAHPNKIQIRYEDLAAKPETAAKSICDFLEIDFQPDMLSYWDSRDTLEQHRAAAMGDKKASQASSIYRSSIDGWKKALSKTELSVLINHLGTAIFHQMGYTSSVEWMMANGLTGEGDPKQVVGTDRSQDPFADGTDLLSRELKMMVQHGYMGYQIDRLCRKLRRFSNTDGPRHVGPDAYVLEELKNIRKFADQLQALTDAGGPYRQKRLEAGVMCRIGRYDRALELLRDLFLTDESNRDEILVHIMQVLQKMESSSSNVINKLIQNFISEISKETSEHDRGEQ